jgi:hypothetical protein
MTRCTAEARHPYRGFDEVRNAVHSREPSFSIRSHAEEFKRGEEALHETRVANVAWFWKGSRCPAHASSSGRRGCGHGEGYSRMLAAYDDRLVRNLV